MKNAKRQDGISPQCLRSVYFIIKIISISKSIFYFKYIFSSYFKLEDLLRATDAASDWQVDAQLKEACSSVVETACKSDDTNPAGVISCLMDK